MSRKIDIFPSVISQLEGIARCVFPMEIEARISLVDIKDKDVGMDVELRYDDVHPKALQYSSNFESAMTCLEHNFVQDVVIDMMRHDHREAVKAFEKYKECQRRRKFGECTSEEVQTGRCKSCDAYGQPRIPGMYSWFPKGSPCVAWHSHVTSEYGDVNELCKPSYADNMNMARRMTLHGIPIRAELITCTSETGEQKTRLFKAELNDMFEDHNIPRESVSLN